ncbi:MAG: Lrp/AsnC family transcriptional regulator [Bacteroidota bacterium]
MKKLNLDAVDIAILKMLQNDGRATTKEMAAACFLSISAVNRRIKRLEASGVIEQYTAILRKKDLELYLVAFVNVRLIDHNENSLQVFRTSIAGLQEIKQCSLTESNNGIILKVVVNDLVSYERFYQEKLLNIPGLGDIHSQLAIAEKKCGTVLKL